MSIRNATQNFLQEHWRRSTLMQTLRPGSRRLYGWGDSNILSVPWTKHTICSIFTVWLGGEICIQKSATRMEESRYYQRAIHTLHHRCTYSSYVSNYFAHLDFFWCRLKYIINLRTQTHKLYMRMTKLQYNNINLRTQTILNWSPEYAHLLIHDLENVPTLYM